jgi:hypothetical protein
VRCCGQDRQPADRTSRGRVSISGFRAIYDLVWLLVQGIDGIGIVSLIALVLNLMVLMVLWSSRSAFGPRPGGGSGPDPDGVSTRRSAAAR